MKRAKLDEMDSLSDQSSGGDTEILSIDSESDNTVNYEFPPDLRRLKRENAMVLAYYDKPLPLPNDKGNPQ